MNLSLYTLLPRVTREVVLVLLFGGQTILTASAQIASAGLVRTNDSIEVYARSGDRYWTANWKETNGGLGDELFCGGINTEDPWVQISVGSRRTQGSAAFRAPPTGKFLIFQLHDSNGVIVAMRSGIKLEQQFAQRIASGDWPKVAYYQDGLFVQQQVLSWGTNAGPGILSQVHLNEVYEITNEGFYTLTVLPVIYRCERDLTYWDRIDLPCLSTNIHLLRHSRHPGSADYAELLTYGIALGSTVLFTLWLTRRRLKRLKDDSIT